MKSQSNSPKRTSKESLQVNSQELDRILGKLASAYTEGDIPEAKAKLLQLALSCLPEKEKGYMPFARGFNAAIDTMEQQIRAKFS